MATESSRSSSSSADSYIGSLISLTSKSEIRYEGILYNINTEESSIGLRNVRSFGTEGRKKDGPKLMPSDKVYEYILFRGSDIKDLQVKSSLPIQPTQPIINNDPAIIQSHYPRPPPISSTPTNSLPDMSIQNPPTLQGGPGPPLYSPGPNPGSWAPMPPHPNPTSTGLPVPMYWPGFYPPPNGVPQLHQQLLRPPLQYPVYNRSLPGGSPLLATDTLPSLMQNKPPDSVGPTESLPTRTPSLVTPGQLLQSAVDSEEEAVQVAPTLESESSIPIPVPVAVEAQPPILPLPPQARIAPKTNRGSYQNRQNYVYRGRERGRGYGGLRSVVKFTEEFDFNAMNEKFNKDEIWGTLGKVNKSTSKENDGNDASYNDDEDEYEDENDADVVVHQPKVDVKGVYSKDDFFDTLSCNSLDNRSNNNARTRFSEQMKLDTETFGEFSRYRGGGRGGYRGGRGGGGGGYYGRGYHSYGGGRMQSQSQSQNY